MKMKKLLCVALCFVILLGIAPLNVIAAESQFGEVDAFHNVDNDDAVINSQSIAAVFLLLRKLLCNI